MKMMHSVIMTSEKPRHETTIVVCCACARVGNLAVWVGSGRVIENVLVEISASAALPVTNHLASATTESTLTSHFLNTRVFECCVCMANVDKQNEKYYPCAATGRVRDGRDCVACQRAVHIRSVADPTARMLHLPTYFSRK